MGFKNDYTDENNSISKDNKTGYFFNKAGYLGQQTGDNTYIDSNGHIMDINNKTGLITRGGVVLGSMDKNGYIFDKDGKYRGRGCPLVLSEDTPEQPFINPEFTGQHHERKQKETAAVGDNGSMQSSVSNVYAAGLASNFSLNNVLCLFSTIGFVIFTIYYMWHHISFGKFLIAFLGSLLFVIPIGFIVYFVGKRFLIYSLNSTSKLVRNLPWLVNIALSYSLSYLIVMVPPIITKSPRGIVEYCTILIMTCYCLIMMAFVSPFIYKDID